MEGARALAHAFRTGGDAMRLEILQLGHTQIGDEGGEALAAAMNGTCSLRMLGLQESVRLTRYDLLFCVSSRIRLYPFPNVLQKRIVECKVFVECMGYTASDTIQGLGHRAASAFAFLLKNGFGLTELWLGGNALTP